MTAVGTALPRPSRGPIRTARSSARPLSQESAGPRLRPVARGARHEIGWRATVVLCVVGTFAALVASVAIQGQRIALQEEADRVAARTVDALDRNRDLRIDVIEAESPAHVLEVARSSGLVEPGPIAVVPAALPVTSRSGAGSPTSDQDAQDDRAAASPAASRKRATSG